MANFMWLRVFVAIFLVGGFFQNCTPFQFSDFTGVQNHHQEDVKHQSVVGVRGSLFSEDFNSGRLSREKWIVEGWAEHSKVVQIDPGDYALRLDGNSQFKNGLRASWPFERGGGLTVTFSMWNEGVFDYTTVSGPWLSTPTISKYLASFPYLNQVEAGFSGQETNGTQRLAWSEGSSIWNWSPLPFEFQSLWRSNARNKLNRVIVRVSLGDLKGAKFEWKRTGESSFRTAIDTISSSQVAGSFYSGTAGNRVSDSKIVWLGFGGGFQRPVFIDDIEVTRTGTQIKRAFNYSNVVSVNSLNYDVNPTAISEPEVDLFPDTLDLADQADKAIKGLAHIRNKNCTEAKYWNCVFLYNIVDFTNKSAIDRDRERFDRDINAILTGGTRNESPAIDMSHKMARTLPLLRQMTGSDHDLAADKYYMKNAMASSAPDVMTNYFGAGQAGVGYSAYVWFNKTFDPKFLEYTHMVNDYLSPGMISGGADKLTFTPETSRTLSGVWVNKWTNPDEKTHPRIPYYPYTSLLPNIDQVGNEGSVKWENGLALRFLTMSHQESNLGMDVARKLKNFIMQPSMWDQSPLTKPGCSTRPLANVFEFWNAGRPADITRYYENYCPDYSLMTSWNQYVPSYPGQNFGTFSHLTHNGVTGLQALLYYAIETGDSTLKNMVKAGLDHAIKIGIPAIGWVPAYGPPSAWNAPKYLSEYSEAGAIGDIIGLAVSISDAGLVGIDYFDQVEVMVRNQLAQSQLDGRRLEAYRLAKAPDIPSQDLQKLEGLFLNNYPTHGDTNTTAIDGNVNAMMGLYHAWNAITRFDNHTATVNLPMNRSARWGNVYSDLPYYGRVRYRNKWASQVKMRVPGHVLDYVNKTEVRKNGVLLLAGGLNPGYTWSGRYAVVAGLRPGDDVQIDFTAEERDVPFTWWNVNYTARMKGHTVISTTPTIETMNSMPGSSGQSHFYGTIWDAYINGYGVNSPGYPVYVAHKTSKYPLYVRSNYPHPLGSPSPRVQKRRIISDRDFPLQTDRFIGIRR